MARLGFEEAVAAARARYGARRIALELAALGELTAGVVHELRNPVSVISGLAELLIRKLEQGDARRGLLRESEQPPEARAHQT